MKQYEYIVIGVAILGMIALPIVPGLIVLAICIGGAFHIRYLKKRAKKDAKR